ncbi:MAG: acyl-CoA dehydrogenase family protein [Parvibaculaceae bacterium]
MTGSSGIGRACDLVTAAAELVPTLAGASAARDAERALPIELMGLVKRSGILGARVSRACGGQEIDFRRLSEIMVHLGAGDPNIAQAIQPHFFLADWLRLEANDEQQRRYFQMMLDGALIANAFAERGGGVVGQTKTTLVRDGVRYRLNGTKAYSTGSLFADYLYATAVREDGSAVAAIFPFDREGVRVLDDWDGMGQRTTASGTTELRQVAIEPDEVFELPGMTTRRTYIGAASQITHASIDVGIARAALSDAVDYARTKARPVADSGVDRAADDPYIIYSIGEMAILLHSAEAMLDRAAAVLDEAVAGQLAGAVEATALERRLCQASIAVAEAKVVAESASLRIGEMMYRAGGAGMTVRKFNYDRHWRNARTHTTHDPAAYKYRAVGDFYLNGKNPGISTKL